MNRSRLLGATTGAGACAVALAIALGGPAQAAPATGWRLVYSHHYGASNHYSQYVAAVTPSATDAWVFGTTNYGGAPAPGTPVAVHWDGSKWSTSALPPHLHSTIMAADAVSADDIWAVTETGGDILHWNGTQWHVSGHVPTPTGGILTGVTAVSSSDAWAFGNGGGFGPGAGTWHFDGQTWAHVTGLGGSVVEASAVSATDIWGSSLIATRSGYTSQIVHFNGTNWTPVRSPALKGLDAGNILALSSTDVWAIAALKTKTGSGGRELLVHFDGTRWTRDTPPWISHNLYDLAPDGSGGLWLPVDKSPSGTNWIIHRTATGHWSRTVAAWMDAISLIPGTTSLWGAGSDPTNTGSSAGIWQYGSAR